MFYLFFYLGLGALVFKSKENSIDPGRIYWPKNSWVVHPITFSSNHAGDQVTMSLSFTVSTSVSAGIVEVHFPAGFDLSGSNFYLTATILSIPTSELVANEDFTLILPNIIMPFAQGAYGPFGIFTRPSATGQIIDMNTNFCNVGVQNSNLPPPSDSLSIEFSDINMNTVNSKSTLVFTFTLTSNLWKYDTFMIQVPQYFSLLNPVCNSIDTGSNTNHFNTTGLTDHEFGCSFNSVSNELSIFGLAVDINLQELTNTNSLLAKFQITGFTNPNADYSSSLYNWNLLIYRSFTANIIQSFSGSGPETSPGLILVNTWVPYNDFDPNNIVSGLTLYMTLSFTADHLIPSGGSFSITFAGVNLVISSWKTNKNQGLTGGTSGYYFLEPYVGGTCALTTTSITCASFASDIQPRSVVSVTLLILFTSTSASVTSISSTLDTVITVDTSVLNPISISYSSTVKLASTYSFFFTSSQDTSAVNRVCNTGGGNYYMALYLQLPSVGIPSTASINLILPLSTLAPSDYYIYTGSVLSSIYVQQPTLGTVLTGGTSLSGVSVTSTSITFSVSVTTSNYLSIIFFINDGTGNAAHLTLPYIGSNLWTRMESRLEVTISNVLYTFSNPITIVPDTPAVNFNLLATNTGYAGLPAFISGSMNFAYTAFFALLIDIQISGAIASDLGSGLASGEVYPFDVDSGSSIPRSAVMTLTVGTSPVLTISGLNSFLTTSIIRAYFPIGSLSASAYTATVSLYYYRKDRNDVKNIIFSTVSTVNPFTSVSNWPTNTLSISNIGINTAITSSPAGGLGITLESASASPVLGYVGIVLPTGFTVKNPSITDGTNYMTNPMKFSSQNIMFAFPGLFAQTTASISLSNSVSKLVQFLGITTAGYFNFGAPQVKISPYETGNIGTACKSIGGTLPTLTLTRSVISPVFSPTTVYGRGPGSLQVNMLIQFTTINPIPQGGYIEFSIDSEWSVTINSVFTVSGVNNSHFSTSAPYQLKGFDAIAGGSQVTITVTSLMPPINSGVISIKQGHIDYLNTFAGTSSQLIDSWIDITDSTVPDSSVNVNVPNPTGSPLFVQASVFPNTASSSSVSTSLTFSLENSLPPGSTISINTPVSGWALNSNIQNMCWFSLFYSSCVVSGTQVVITLLEAYQGGVLYLLIDNALDLPSSITGTLSFAVTSTFNSVLIDITGDVTTNQTLSIVTPPSPLFTPIGNGVTVDPNNAGERSQYVFTFTVGANIVLGDQIWINFPNNYDAYIGEAQVLFIYGEPNNYYLNCLSAVLGDISCYTDHWYLIITNMNTINAGVNIDITLSQVVNPSASTVTFQMYLLDKHFGIKASKNNFGSVAIGQVSDSNIVIREIDMSNSYLQEVSDYNFTFYLDSITFATNDALLFIFPQQYDLDRDLTSVSIGCSSSYYDESVGSAGLTTVWDTNLNCSYLGSNTVQVNISTLGSWSLTDRITITLFSVPNPDWGFSRGSFFDANSPQYFPTYSNWTNSFTISAYSTLLANYVGNSYGNLASGFLGLNDRGMIFSIGGYDPSTKLRRILVVPGSQTLDIPIQITQRLGLLAKKVVFKPTSYYKNNVNLQFTSEVHDFFITEGLAQINFRVSAPISAQNQLAYIQWDIDEYSLIGLTGNAYQSPAKTLVEVYAMQDFSLTTQSNINLNPNSTSIPIPVTAQTPPNTNITLALSFQDPTLNGIQISPISLIFSQGTVTKYFTISVSSTFNGVIGNSYALKFGLTGEDASIYTLPSCSFTVLSSAVNETSNLVFTLENLSSVSVDVYVTSQTNTLVYWQISGLGTNFYTYAQMLNLVKPLVNSESSKNLALVDQLSEYHSNLEYQPLTNETWADFEQRLYSASLSKIWYDLNYVSAGQQTLLFSADWLWAETEYLVQAYAYAEPTTVYNCSVTTPDLALAITIELLFSGLVVESKAYPLTTIIAYNLGVPQQQLLTQSVISTQGFADSQTLFEWILTANRGSNVSPLQLFNQIDPDTLANDVLDSGITNTVISLTAQLVQSSQYQSPYWTNSGYPTFYNATDSSLVISLRSAVTGSMCCTAEVKANNNSQINPTQIYLMLGRNNLPTHATCVSNSATDFSNYLMQITGLTNNTFYWVTCAAFNTYPLWPESTPYDSVKNLLPSFNVSTMNSTVEIVVSANANFIFFSCSLFLLIN